jgi:aromatic ring-opening dioxygenase catalytic subunit (LigB family)
MACPLLLHRTGRFGQALRHCQGDFVHLVVSGRVGHAVTSRAHKKTDVAEHPEVFRHVGLLFNKQPSSARQLFI